MSLPEPTSDRPWAILSWFFAALLWESVLHGPVCR